MKIKQLLCMISLGASFIANAAEFSLASTDIAQDQPLTRREVFKGFGCDGDNVSPPALLARRTGGNQKLRHHCIRS